MNSEPVSYDSLKTVLQYMEANVRFKVSQNIRSIRAAERAVPLKINDLTLDGRKIVVNKTEYNLGIYLKYHDDGAPVPNGIQSDNDSGGAQYNFDQYGIRDHSSDHLIMTPGDVKIGRAFKEPLARLDRMARMQRLERQIEWLEMVLAQARQRGEEIFETTLPIVQDGVQRAGFFYGAGIHVSTPKQHLKIARDILVPYHCWRDDCQPPFQMLIQCTVTSESAKQIHRMVYNKKIHEARKHLSNFLFGKRRSPIQVISFNVHAEGIVFRLPLGLKLKIQKLIIPSRFAEYYEPLKPILEASSFPLKLLKIVTCRYDNEFNDPNDYKHPIVTNAEKLIIWNEGVQDWWTVVQSLSNRRIHLKVSSWGYEAYIGLIQNWMDTGRKIGTHFSLGFDNGEEANAEFLELVKQRFNGAISHEQSLTLRMTDSLDLKVSYKADPHPNVHYGHHWILKMKVIQHVAQ